MIDKLLRIKDVIEATGKSKSGIYADIAIGSFPAPVAIGARAVAWRTSMIANWIESRISCSPELA